jgi:glycerol-3-phosphate acyltransferase PlsX
VDEVMGMLDYRTIGGTQFLGIKKPVIKAHGSSDALAFTNAIYQARSAAQHNMAEELEKELQKLSAEKE